MNPKVFQKNSWEFKGIWNNPLAFGERERERESNNNNKKSKSYEGLLSIPTHNLYEEQIIRKIPLSPKTALQFDYHSIKAANLNEVPHYHIVISNSSCD